MFLIIAFVFHSDMPPLKQLLTAGFLFLLASAALARVKGPVLQVEIVARGNPARPSEMYWALTALPTGKDILIDDASLRAALLQGLKMLAQRNVPEWNFKERAEGNFKTELQSILADEYGFTIQSESFPSFDASTDLGPRKIPLIASYNPNVVIQVVRKKLALHIVVQGSTTISARPVATTLGNVARHGVGGLADLSEDEKAFPVWVADAKSQGSGSEWENSPEHLHAYEAAVVAFASAKKNNLQEAVANQGNTSQTVVTEITNALQAQFSLTKTWEMVSLGETKELLLFKNDTWVFQIPLHAVGNVKFELAAIQTEGKEIPWDDYPYRTQLAENKARAEKAIEEKREPQFSNFRGKLLTREELLSRTKSILTKLEQNGNVLHASGPGSRDYDLVFNGVWLPRETEFTAGVGYSTDKGFGGKLALTSRNLFVKNSLLNLGIEAGTEKQDGHFSYVVPDYYKSPDGRWSAQLDLTADYMHDDDQKLGAPDQAGIREERATGALKNVLQFVANPANAGANNGNQPETWGYGATLETTLGYSDVQLGTPQDHDPEVQDGSDFFAFANLQQRGWRDLRKPEAPGVGKVELFWQLRAKKGFSALGDFDFFCGDTTFSFTVYFGSESSRDFFIRVLGGGALCSTNTPIFEQFPLGGDTIVRGLEEGERLARGVVYDSVEGGIRAGRIWQWISPTLDTAPVASELAGSASEPAAKPGGFDLANVYVSLFFDHAYITRSSSRSGADELSRDLESLGVAIEIPLPTSAVRGRLRIGYAWSPQSIHEQGRSFFSATIDFP